MSCSSGYGMYVNCWQDRMADPQANIIPLEVVKTRHSHQVGVDEIGVEETKTLKGGDAARA